MAARNNPKSPIGGGLEGDDARFGVWGSGFRVQGSGVGGQG